MSKKQKVDKICFVCKRGFDADKDKELFVEAGGIVACKSHHGVEKWYKDAVKDAALVLESPVKPA